jgi:hypothetical protein
MVRRVTVSRNSKTANVIASAPVGQPTDQIVKGVEEISAAGKQTEAALAPTLQQPPDEHSSETN